MFNNFLRVNQRQAIHETFDDEVVIVNLESGSYYSLDHVGATIWHWLEQGAHVSAIQQNIAARYQGDPAEIQGSVQKFLDELLKESLVLAHDAPDSERDSSSEIAGEKVAFVAPVLNKYTDMEELLLLDPIHEVDELGWPAARTDPGK
jgi:hypothetical protein